MQYNKNITFSDYSEIISKKFVVERGRIVNMNSSADPGSLWS